MRVVQVRFPEGARSFACAAAGHRLEVGDRCIVDTERGPQFGVVTQSTLEIPIYDGRRGSSLPRVLREATQDDEESFAHKVAHEREAREFCRKKIAERGLPMKLGFVERLPDGRKTVFYFTAERRVDFRGLVRDLAGKLRTRVELRQIGSRDDAGMLGGCGSCGRSLCCSTFLRRFEPVSIKMAKLQGLSLNPSKISGLCGRLMCCLRYEYEPKSKPAPDKPAPPQAGEATSGPAG